MHFTDILPLLASDAYQTAQQLSERLQISSSQLADYLFQIRELGIEIHFSENKGYCLKVPLDLINPADIIGALTPMVAAKLDSHTYLSTTTSTNKVALDQSFPTLGKFSFITTEMQTKGRGRRGRNWHSPYAQNIYLSIVWPLSADASRASTLSPYLALEVVELLDALAVPTLGLKWPNDIVCCNKKISGLLIESVYQSKNKMYVVIRFGLNVAMKNVQTGDIDQEWTDITSQFPGWSLSRNNLTAQLINTLVTALIRFESDGVINLKNRWKHWDIMHNRSVNVSAMDGDTKGIAKGIDEDGSLLLQVDSEQRKIVVGDVSLRALE